MHDYEKLGAFYLGRRHDDGKPGTELVLYDPADLTTHATIIGMTGSGKTGLGIALIEEAAIDRVPVIAIDPKGDLGNLLLTFPGLQAADFEPWVDPRQADIAGQQPAEFAAAQAALWRKGLADWGQDAERIQRLRDAADFALYTPGSSAGLPISVLGSLAAPPAKLREDADLYRQHVQGVTTGLLTLIGIDADPVSSREHILLATLLDHHWQQNRSLDLAALIGAIQQPGIARVGIMDLESFYPAKDRFELAMRLNNLLASPGFEAWTQGEPLDAGTLLYTPAGKPRVSVISIAHLPETERMFFVTLLLNEVIAWMRSQPGTSSLRAILYMDEVFGYLPPVANPPTKPLLLTLLKQARAYGLGVVLATQNPVDLDYKALSNAGTWFIGRLQTEQDRNRVRDGLLSAAGGLDASVIDGMLGSLQKRCFLLHNVHESAPIIFQTRWVLAYLRGPLTRDDIRRLQPKLPEPAAPARAATAAAAPVSHAQPPIPPDVPMMYAATGRRPGAEERVVYHARLLGAARVAYVSAKHNVNIARELVLALEPGDGLPDWNAAETLDIDAAALNREPQPDAAFTECPPAVASASAVNKAQQQFRKFLKDECPVTLWQSKALKATSGPDETEAQFRIRLQQLAREERDRKTAALREKYAPKLATLTERLRRSEQAVEREAQQASSSKMATAVSVGAAVLGSLLGRRAVSATSASRVGSAIRQASNISKQSGDVERAKETTASVQAQIAELEARVSSEIEALDVAYDAQAEKLEQVDLRPKATDITVRFFGLGWLPYIEDANGNLAPGWA